MNTSTLLLAIASFLFASAVVDAFSNCPSSSGSRPSIAPLDATSRRAFMATSVVSFVGFAAAGSAVAADESVSSLIDELVESKKKLSQVPDLIKAEEWEAVRAILKNPPVNTLWNMGDGKNPMLKISKATDEFELIDLKDELGISLQMCDQFVYSNEFIYYQPGDGKIKVKEPTELAKKAMSQLGEAIDMAKSAAK
jgi:hypothetical protein